MPRKTLIAGNWKMNKTVAEALELIDGLKTGVAEMDAVEVLVCPPFTCLAAVVEATKGTPIMVGAQNVHWAESGAFTAEISAAMLTEISVTHAIIGHSERRQYFAETDETVSMRLKAALAAGLTPVVCFGETLEQRQAGETEAVVGTQVKGALAGIASEQMEKTVLAYEPVWAIGTGMTATPEQAQDVHAFVRGILSTAYGDLADDIQILYGGSVKAANAAELMGQPDIDGGLVGGASLGADDFLGIIRNAS